VAQQLHLDVMVDDVPSACELVVALGGTTLGGSAFADLAGHPFCLVRRPGWAETAGEVDPPAGVAMR
jgi:hypothetical protein